MPSLSLWLRDGTHLLAARTWEPRPLARAGQSRPAAPVGARKPSIPAGRSFRRTARMASADSEVGPGPRPLTISPRQNQCQGGRAEGLSIHILTPEFGVTRDPARIGIGECGFPILGTQAGLRVSHDLHGASQVADTRLPWALPCRQDRRAADFVPGSSRIGPWRGVGGLSLYKS